MMMRSALILTVFLMSLLALAVSTPTINAVSSTQIKGVTYEFDVIKFAKVSSKTYAIEFNLTVTLKIANYSSTELEIPLGIPFLTQKKYSKAVNPSLLECSVTFKDSNIVDSASLVTSGVSRVAVKLKEPIEGKDWASVRIVVHGMVKSTSQLYVTKDYKYYKDYKPVNGKILFVRVINYFYNVNWETDKVNGIEVPGIRVKVVAPKGWTVLYARSSLTGKLRYMDVHYVGEENGKYMVEFWYLSSKTVKPATFKAGSEFDIEVGFTPISDSRNPVSMGFGVLLILLAAFFTWYYRDVWKYVTRKVSVVTKHEQKG